MPGEARRGGWVVGVGGGCVRAAGAWVGAFGVVGSKPGPYGAGAVKPGSLAVAPAQHAGGIAGKIAGSSLRRPGGMPPTRTRPPGRDAACYPARPGMGSSCGCARLRASAAPAASVRCATRFARCFAGPSTWRLTHIPCVVNKLPTEHVQHSHRAATTRGGPPAARTGRHARRDKAEMAELRSQGAVGLPGARPGKSATRPFRAPPPALPRPRDRRHSSARSSRMMPGRPSRPLAARPCLFPAQRMTVRRAATAAMAQPRARRPLRRRGWSCSSRAAAPPWTN